MGKIIDLTGQRFGRLVALESKPSFSVEMSRLWRCRCDCGAETFALSPNLRAGRTKSCGCYKRERSAATAHRHGGKGTPEYVTWGSMKSRCQNPKNRKFKDYGARGIAVCERWQSDFAAFLADMGPKPTSKHSIDRWPDNDGNYEPANCRWATPKEQAANRRPARRKKS